MSTLKKLQKLLTSKNVLFLTAVFVLSIALANYSFLKGMVVDGMTGGNYSVPENSNSPSAKNGLPNANKLPQEYDDVKSSPYGGSNGDVMPYYNDMFSSSPSNVNGISGTTANGNYAPAGMEDPASLLPTDANNEWSMLNPVGAHDLKNVSLLKAGYHIGINTVGQSLRNPNLQVRSEPPNPQFNVGPFNNSTIGPDLLRPTFEIGSCAPM